MGSACGKAHLRPFLKGQQEDAEFLEVGGAGADVLVVGACGRVERDERLLTPHPPQATARPVHPVPDGVGHAEAHGHRLLGLLLDEALLCAEKRNRVERLARGERLRLDGAEGCAVERHESVAYGDAAVLGCLAAGRDGRDAIVRAQAEPKAAGRLGADGVGAEGGGGQAGARVAIERDDDVAQPHPAARGLRVGRDADDLVALVQHHAEAERRLDEARRVRLGRGAGPRRAHAEDDRSTHLEGLELGVRVHLHLQRHVVDAEQVLVGGAVGLPRAAAQQGLLHVRVLRRGLVLRVAWRLAVEMLGDLVDELSALEELGREHDEHDGPLVGGVRGLAIGGHLDATLLKATHDLVVERGRRRGGIAALLERVVLGGVRRRSLGLPAGAEAGGGELLVVRTQRRGLEWLLLRRLLPGLGGGGGARGRPLVLEDTRREEGHAPLPCWLGRSGRRLLLRLLTRVGQRWFAGARPAGLSATGDGIGIVVLRLGATTRREGGVVVETLGDMLEHRVLVLLLAVPLERTLRVPTEQPLHGGMLLGREPRALAREEEVDLRTEAGGGEAACSRVGVG
eukprot:scaffold20686_cov79-Phaeocystis_antarctica.AAC.7